MFLKLVITNIVQYIVVWRISVLKSFGSAVIVTHGTFESLHRHLGRYSTQRVIIPFGKDMPITRSLAGKNPSCSRMDTEAPAGEHTTVSVVGPQASVKGSKSSGSVVASAKLRFESMRMELQRQAAEFEHRQKMQLMEAEHELRKAEMVASTRSDVDSRLDEDLVDSNRKVTEYLSQHLVEKPFEAAYPTYPAKEDVYPIQAARPVGDLPKVELITFDGSSSTYWKFFRQFEIYVESRTSDEGQRFLYLLHYCRGLAREAIEECVMLPPEVAYRRARSILKDLFGQPHVISRSILDGLFKEFETVSATPDRLAHLVVRMKSCQIALEQMQYSAELNSLLMLERLSRSLPFHLQQQWAECAAQCTQTGREPNFGDFVDFLDSRARVATSRFGQMVEEKRRTRRPVLREMKADQSLKPCNNFAQVNVRNEKIEVGQRCLICGGPHWINSCEEFKTMNTDDRWKKVKFNRLCFGCLHSGHSVSQCRKIKRCMLDGCKSQHHPLLHSKRTPVQDVKSVNSVNNSQIVALGVVPIHLRGPKGQLKAYAFLDSGSDSTLICRDVVDDLGFKTERFDSSIKTVNGCMPVHDCVPEIALGTLDGCESIDARNAIVVNGILPHANLIPRSTLAARWSHINDVPFEEVSCKRIVILIGCDVPEAHWAIEQRIGARKQPYAVKTLLGWVLFGPTNYGSNPIASVNQMLRKKPIGETEAQEWESWVNLVKSLGELNIPRCMSRNDHDEGTQVELHVFADASELGYGVVAYAVYIHQIYPAYLSLLFAKSRVAPLKVVTIPRLELTAAVLAVKVSRILRAALPDYFDRIRFWTDSKIVLHYINDHQTRFTTFVANRLTVIHQYSSADQWRYVKSAHNPADMASRGINSVNEVRRWLEEPFDLPKHLAYNEDEDLTVPIEELEHKKVMTTLASSLSPENPTHAVLAYHSDFNKLLRSIAWLMRYVEFLKMKAMKSSIPIQKKYISVLEMRAARRYALKFVQQESFATDLTQLTKGNRDVRKCSRLLRLNPIMLDGLICVGGRMRCNQPSSWCHPIILPAKHAFTESLIRHYHESEGHRGAAHVLTVIRQKFWIIHGVAAVKRVIRRCFKCLRNSALNCKQMMAPLPACRIERGRRCFESVGVDYFGPFLVKRGRSMEKRFGCVFTCLRMRAVHLEVAHSLSTDSFILALMRFISRRGRPKEIYSDNGTNFVGAVRELKEHFQRWDQKKLNDHLLERDCQWHFHPPECSHRGGVWERIIRSVRSILNAIVAEQTLTDESLVTFFVEAERILNNRPLVPPSSDCRDNSPLTPNHLLLMEGNIGIPSECDRLQWYTRRWRQVNHLCDVFWSRWSREYLPTLQSRQKWFDRSRNLKEGDIVLVTSEQSKRDQWPLAIITDCTPDADGLVRTVGVRTSNGRLTRDVRKICLLEGVD